METSISKIEIVQKEGNREVAHSVKSSFLPTKQIELIYS